MPIRLLLLFLVSTFICRADRDTTAAEKTFKRIYVFSIMDEIGPAAWRNTQKAMDDAQAWNADLVVLRLNTYGGLLDKADSIRTRLLHAPMPVYVLIENNAASAGALISLACHKIYMQPGSKIGAASVVNESGELAPDKYQSYMRAMMRATAESRGRNPAIAEAMVDGKTVIPGLNKEGQVLTLTSREAIKQGYCEGEVASLENLLKKVQGEQAEVKEQELGSIDRIISLLINPALSGILILLILGGIYYEMQAPGLGFPSVVSILAALLYFAPLYLEGLAQNWEILLFIIGVILLALEFFVIPGFGVAGISGLLLIASSLVLSLIRNIDFDFSLSSTQSINRALLTVFLSLCAFVAFIFILGRSVLKSSRFRKLVLETDLGTAKAPLAYQHDALPGLLTTGICITDLRPLGKAEINGHIYTVNSATGFISKGSRIQVLKADTRQITVGELKG